MIPLKDENPTQTFPFITISLIALNILVYIYEWTLDPEALRLAIRNFGIVPYHLTHIAYDLEASSIPRLLTLITSTFLHGGIIHLGFNMLFFWIFGNNIEDVLGHFKFILFYFASGSIAGLSQSFIIPYSTIPIIGASGAVAGILGAYLLLYPRARILTLFWFFFFIRIVRVPTIIFLGFWFFIQVLSAGTGGNVAWYSHIGGFIAGLVMILPVWIKRRRFFRS